MNIRWTLITVLGGLLLLGAYTASSSRRHAQALPAPERDEPQPAPLSEPKPRESLRRPPPKEYRATLIDTVTRTGPSQEPWTLHALNVFTDWQKAADPALSAHVKSALRGCYKTGCVVDMTCDDLPSCERSREDLVWSKPFASWTSSKVALPSMSTGNGGAVVITWILAKPTSHYEPSGQSIR